MGKGLGSQLDVNSTDPSITMAKNVCVCIYAIIIIIIISILYNHINTILTGVQSPDQLNSPTALAFCPC